MAVNLINNEQIHVIQDGSNITLDIQDEALKNDSVVVGSIRSKNTLQNGASANTNSYGITVKTNDDGSVSLTGTQASATVYFTDVKKILAKDIQNGNYTLSFSNSSYSNIAYRIRKYNGSNKTTIVNETLLSSADYSYTFNLKGLIDNDTTQVEIDIICYETNAKNVSLSPQLELGDTASQYFPYQELNAQNIGNYWQDKSSSITIKDNKVQSQRTKLFINPAMRLVFLQVYFADTLNVGTTTDIIEFPLEYKPAFLNSDDLWIPMQYSNGGNAPIIRGQLKFDSSKCYIDLLCINVAAGSAYGNIVYPY